MQTSDRIRGNLQTLPFRRPNPSDYGSYGYGHDHDPLKRSKIQDEKDLIRELKIAQVFGDCSNDDISKAIARRRPDVCSTIGADDVKSILSSLKDNCVCGANNYAQLKELAAPKKYGNGSPEAQEALKEWDIDIDRAKAGQI